MYEAAVVTLSRPRKGQIGFRFFKPSANPNRLADSVACSIPVGQLPRLKEQIAEIERAISADPHERPQDAS